MSAGLTPTHTLDIVSSPMFSLSGSRCFNSHFCPLSSLLVDARWVGFLRHSLLRSLALFVLASFPSTLSSLPPLQLLSALTSRLTNSSNLGSNFFSLPHLLSLQLCGGKRLPLPMAVFAHHLCVCGCVCVSKGIIPKFHPKHSVVLDCF